VLAQARRSSNPASQRGRPRSTRSRAGASPRQSCGSAAATPPSLRPGPGCCAARGVWPSSPPAKPLRRISLDEQFQCLNPKLTGIMRGGHTRWDQWGDAGGTAAQGMLQPARVLPALPVPPSSQSVEGALGTGAPHRPPCFPPRFAPCPGGRMQGGEQMRVCRAHTPQVLRYKQAVIIYMFLF